VRSSVRSKINALGSVGGSAMTSRPASAAASGGSTRGR
jgi:hypothetical protein